ncbi:MAG: hypothetical protein A2Z52_02140 [Candidatus Moranbacteria bacterium RBG_19FT_COMBO_42_6]|nr:MAG: hypothetical protein A2Z52_02140 [Candidatus Moranbacteria bacterium RBG_19FT_COMBO_42_6]
MSRKASLLSDKFRAMGTDVSIDVVLDGNVSEEKAQKAFETARAIFEKYEQIFSRFRKDSELSELNKNIGKTTRISDEMLEVLKLCISHHKASECYFDPRVIEILEQIGYDKDFSSNDFNASLRENSFPEKINDKLEKNIRLSPEKKAVFLERRIDTTGIVKGYAVDKTAEALVQEGLQDFIIDAGGDMYIEGRDAEKKEWRVAIEGIPENKLMLKLSHTGIATSGISRKRWQRGDRKFHHLINPKNPETFTQDLKTVTVVDEKTVDADALAKTLFIMGKNRGIEFADKNGIKALFLDYRGNIVLSKEIKEKIIAN